MLSLLLTLGCSSPKLSADLGRCALNMPELSGRLEEARALLPLVPHWADAFAQDIEHLPSAEWPVDTTIRTSMNLVVTEDGRLTSLYGTETRLEWLVDDLSIRDSPQTVRLYADPRAPASVVGAINDQVGSRAELRVVARLSPQPPLQREPVPAHFADGVARLKSGDYTLDGTFDPYPGLFEVCPVDRYKVAGAPYEQKAELLVDVMLQGYALCGCQESVSTWVFWYQHTWLPEVFLTDRALPATLPPGKTWGEVVAGLR